MERTVPRSNSEEIELYLRTIYSLLRSTTEVQIRTLEEVHAATGSSLHSGARQPAPDASAFIYSLLRLPDCMPQVRLVLLGQSQQVFASHGFPGVETWQTAPARARRRRCFFDGSDTLACYIASQSDIEDVIPALTAYQVEWNKLHLLLNRLPREVHITRAAADEAAFNALAAALLLPAEDLRRLQTIWGDDFTAQLGLIAARPCQLFVRLLSGSLAEYWRATRAWWENIEHACPPLLERPVYFISSNTHSVANLLSGFAMQCQPELDEFLHCPGNDDLLAEWEDIRSRKAPASQENFLYYVLKKYTQTGNPALLERQTAHERACGISRVASEHYFDVDAQVIEVRHLQPGHFDPRLGTEGFDFLQHSDALILNIDYPLGFAAYNILTKVAEHASPVLGVYIMGKAATLNGRLGDVMIPGVVYDEHSQNTYMFQNALCAGDVTPNLVFGTVLDNQKSVSVLGTFLQNADLMDVFYREGYTDIEMEAGPYLSAMYEMYRPKRHPVNEIVNLYGAPFDVGILHYASDTPLGKGKNLGAGALSYFGMDSTYACSVAILRRILALERARGK